MTIEELEIMKSALEGDVMRQIGVIERFQRQPSLLLDFDDWLDWLSKSEILLKKVSLKLMDMKAVRDISKDYSIGGISNERN